MIHKCAICDREISSFRGNFFCGECYKQWKPEIISKVPWIQVIKNFELRRRRHEIRDNFIYLGDDFDVNTDGDLIKISKDG